MNQVHKKNIIKAAIILTVIVVIIIIIHLVGNSLLPMIKNHLGL